MGTGHEHAAPSGANRRALWLALAVAGSFLLVEAAGGWLTGSLALVADAGHMLTDVAAIALSLFAFTMAARPATHARTYGFKRVEILAAAGNGIALVLIAVYIAWEAIRRLDDPAGVESGPMLAIAVGGLLCNLLAMRLLVPAREANLNMRGAFLHVLGDLLGSAGAILAALIMLTTGWTRADPLISLLIAALIVFSAWRLIRESLDVLLEATPAGLDVGAMEAALTSIPGVRCIHDVHVWTVTSGFVAMSGHIEIDDQADYNRVMIAAHEIVRERYGIAHSTLQVETPELEARLPEQHLPGDQPCLSGHVQAEMVAHPHRDGRTDTPTRLHRPPADPGRRARRRRADRRLRAGRHRQDHHVR